MASKAGIWEQAFVDHPRSLGVGYLTHAGGALRIAAMLFKAGSACVVHAAVPGAFTRTASRTIRELHRGMEARHERGSAWTWSDYEI